MTNESKSESDESKDYLYDFKFVFTVMIEYDKVRMKS